MANKEKNLISPSCFLLWPFILVLCLLLSGQAFAKGHDNRERGFKKHMRGYASDINLAENPLSVKGTYKIDRLIIKDGDKVLLDSENDYMVRDDIGMLALNMKIEDGIIIDMVYKMQMRGPAFQNPEIADYSFLYDKKTFHIEHKSGSPISDSLATIGIHIYDHEDILWELPFETNKKLILKIEKKNDEIIPTDDKPFVPTQY